MKPSRLPLVSAALAAALALAGCGGDSPTVPDDVPGTTLPTDIPGLPTGAGQMFTQGTAHVELSGGLDVAYDLPITAQTSVFNPPPAGATLTYADTAGNSFAMGGAFNTGPTSTTLVVTITSVEPQLTLLTSLAGECTVTFDNASVDGVTGSFACEGLSPGGTGPTVDATGEFEASA